MGPISCHEKSVKAAVIPLEQRALYLRGGGKPETLTFSGFSSDPQNKFRINITNLVYKRFLDIHYNLLFTNNIVIQSAVF